MTSWSVVRRRYTGGGGGGGGSGSGGDIWQGKVPAVQARAAAALLGGGVCADIVIWKFEILQIFCSDVKNW